MVESSFVLSTAMESSFVLKVTGSPVDSPVESSLVRVSAVMLLVGQ